MKMKLLGLALLLLCALILSREYKGYQKKKIAECEGFIAFLGYMRLELRCFLRSPREMGRSFENEAISAFLSSLENEDSIHKALKVSKGALSLTDDECRPIAELFSAIGGCYADDGIRLIDAALLRLDELHSELVANGERSARVFGTVSSAVSVGLFILLI
jgi:hypothetical protein